MALVLSSMARKIFAPPWSWRYVEFFTANIRNPNTRRAYARACGSFLTWCEERGLTLTPVHPRRRGERVRRSGGGAISPGSSPQARGTPRRLARRRLANRFIPAGAGNALNIILWYRRRTVHPRRRGERHHRIFYASFEIRVSAPCR